MQCMEILDTVETTVATSKGQIWVLNGVSHYCRISLSHWEQKPSNRKSPEGAYLGPSQRVAANKEPL